MMWLIADRIYDEANLREHLRLSKSPCWRQKQIKRQSTRSIYAMVQIYTEGKAEQMAIYASANPTAKG